MAGPGWGGGRRQVTHASHSLPHQSLARQGQLRTLSWRNKPGQVSHGYGPPPRSRLPGPGRDRDPEATKTLIITHLPGKLFPQVPCGLPNTTSPGPPSPALFPGPSLKIANPFSGSIFPDVTCLHLVWNRFYVLFVYPTNVSPWRQGLYPPAPSTVQCLAGRRCSFNICRINE